METCRCAIESYNILVYEKKLYYSINCVTNQKECLSRILGPYQLYGHSELLQARD